MVAASLLVMLLAGCSTGASSAPSTTPIAAPTATAQPTPTAASPATAAPTPTAAPAVASPPASALDQSQEHDEIFVTSGLGGFGQTFTAGKSGSLIAVSLKPHNDWLALGDLVIEIRTVSGGLPTSKVIASTTPTSAAVDTWVDFTFASAADVVAGKAYAIVLRSAYGIDARRSNDDTYPGGGWVFNDGSTWTNGGGDLAFRIYVAKPGG